MIFKFSLKVTENLLRHKNCKKFLKLEGKYVEPTWTRMYVCIFQRINKSLAGARSRPAKRKVYIFTNVSEGIHFGCFSFKTVSPIYVPRTNP